MIHYLDQPRRITFSPYRRPGTVRIRVAIETDFARMMAVFGRRGWA